MDGFVLSEENPTELQQRGNKQSLWTLPSNQLGYRANGRRDIGSNGS